MKKFLSVIIGMVLVASAAYAIFPQDTRNQALLSRANQFDPLPNIGNVINQTRNLLRCTYNFATLGGATGTINLVDDQGNACILKQNAIVQHSWLNVTTAVTGGSNSTIGFSSGLTAGDLLTSTNGNVSSTYGTTGFYDGKPAYNGAVSTYVGPITAQNGSQVTMAIGTAAVTAGVIELFMDYVFQ